MIGGTTYEEARYIAQLNANTPGLRIVLGGTSVLNNARQVLLLIKRWTSSTQYDSEFSCRTWPTFSFLEMLIDSSTRFPSTTSLASVSGSVAATKAAVKLLSSRSNSAR